MKEEVAQLRERLEKVLKAKKLEPVLEKVILQVTDLRPLRVVVHILEHGSVSTEELGTKFDYGHPPRGARDLKERGVPLVTKFGKTSTGKRMAVYVLGDASKVIPSRRGRGVFSKPVKDALLEHFRSRCVVCLAELNSRTLQVDHRIPYEIAGNSETEKQDETTLMPLCSACNRAKSWECENCPNWAKRDLNMCMTCHWAFPEEYEHIAGVELRRVVVTWQGEQIVGFRQLKLLADQRGVPVGTLIRNLLAEEH